MDSRGIIIKRKKKNFVHGTCKKVNLWLDSILQETLEHRSHCLETKRSLKRQEVACSQDKSLLLSTRPSQQSPPKSNILLNGQKLKLNQIQLKGSISIPTESVTTWNPQKDTNQCAARTVAEKSQYQRSDQKNQTRAKILHNSRVNQPKNRNPNPR